MPQREHEKEKGDSVKKMKRMASYREGNCGWRLAVRAGVNQLVGHTSNTINFAGHRFVDPKQEISNGWFDVNENELSAFCLCDSLLHFSMGCIEDSYLRWKHEP